jgi:Ca2+-binding RTX toxin-like protein
MSLFVGTNANETITPDLVSPTVRVAGAPTLPSSATDLIFSGAGDDIVAGGGGNDLAFLGSGNDRFIWNPGDGSDAVSGDRGTDTMEFNGSGADEIMNVSTDRGGLAKLTRNVGNITMLMNDLERIEIDAAVGADTIAVGDLSRTDVEQVAIDLASAPGATVGDAAVDSISVEGRSKSDQVTLALEGETVVVNGLPAQVTIDRAEADDRLNVMGLGGKDVIDASALPSTSMNLTLDGGAGDDRLLGSAKADVLIGGDGKDFIDGNGGNDTAFMGNGNDTFQWDPGDGSDVVEGEAGIDTMLFNGSGAAENIDISANGERARFFRDVANIVMDLNDVERVEFNALGGPDTIVVNDLSTTDVRKVEIDLGGAAGQATDTQQDTIIANGAATDESIKLETKHGATTVNGLPAEVRISGVDAGLDRLTVNGQAGNDVIDASKAASNSLLLSLLGGAGDDKLIGSAGNDFVDGDQGTDTAFLGAGDDTFQWDPGDGSDVVEGQAGTDTLVFNGSGASETITISANGERAIFFRDVGNITMDNNDVERFEFNALGGADTINIADMSATDVTEVVVDLASAIGADTADGLADTVNADGTTSNDAITVSVDASGLLVSGLSADIRVEHADVGLDTLAIDTGDGNDTLNAGNSGATLIGGLGDDTFVGTNFVVEDFQAGAGSEDRIDLRGLGFELDDVLASLTFDEGTGDTLIDLGEVQITLRDVAPEAMHADDFVL